MHLFKLIGEDTDEVRVSWVRQCLRSIPAGSRTLDAGAGELLFKPDCQHLDYVAQDFGQYGGGWCWPTNGTMGQYTPRYYSGYHKYSSAGRIF